MKPSYMRSALTGAESAEHRAQADRADERREDEGDEQ